LVFHDSDGKEYVIRGGPKHNVPLPVIRFGNIVTEQGQEIKNSEDK
jgi:hypothetical protein